MDIEYFALWICLFGVLALIGALLGRLFPILMSDRALIAHALWTDRDGFPLNEFADEYVRRHGKRP